MKHKRCWCCWLIFPLVILFLGFLGFYFLEAMTRFVYDKFTTNFGSESFLVNVPTNDRTVDICVRDYGCEDGDRVRLFLNSQQVFSGEIYWEKRCVSREVNVGAHIVKLYAINGTGGKGSCPNNINTGEVEIGKLNWKSQSWALEPGTEGSATLQVNIQQ